MKYFKILSALFFFSTLFYACQKEYSVEVPISTNNSSFQWQFTESGVTYKGKVDTAYVDTLGQFKILTITGTSTDGKDHINLMVNSQKLAAGTFNNPSCGYGYIRSGATVYQTDLTDLTDSFTITITKIDSSGVVGTFTGKAKDKTGAYHIITAGQFNASFKSNSNIVTPPILDSGNVVFWAKAACNGGTNPVSVTVEGKTGSITIFDTSKTCGSNGKFTTTLAVGTHTWKATCGTTNISGTVIVTKGTCTAAQVDFTVPTGNYFPVTTNDTWTYLNMATNALPDDSITVRSTGGTVVLSSNTYNVFENSYAQFTSIDSGFFRVGSGLYYEFLGPNSGPLANFNANPVEYKFLDEKSNSWTSGSTTGSAGGLNIAININSTIIGTSAAQVAVGSFPDVIKVRNSYMYKPSLAPAYLEVYREDHWYARGVGLIKRVVYSDPTNLNSVVSSYELTNYKVY
jgi:hypothetical protein